MSILIGALDVFDDANGYHFEFEDGGPVDAITVVRGRRVLIPGAAGLYTPASNFEDDHLAIMLKGRAWGDGSSEAARAESFRTRMDALRTACDVANRADVTITVADIEGLGDNEATIDAGFLRFRGPAARNDWREFEIHFEATATLAWEISSS